MKMKICFPEKADPPFIFLSIMAIFNKFVDSSSITITSTPTIGWQAEFVSTPINEETMEDVKKLIRDHQYTMVVEHGDPYTITIN